MNIIGAGNVYGENSRQTNHESTGHYDVNERAHIRKVNNDAASDHMSAMFQGSYESPAKAHHAHNPNYGRESMGGLSFGRRKWCQVDSELDREKSVLQKSAINSLGGHTHTFSSPRVSESINHNHDRNAITPRRRDPGYPMRTAGGRQWRTNNVQGNVSPRVGRNINDEIMHRGTVNKVVQSQYNQSSFLEAASETRQIASKIKGQMNFSRKDIIDYNETTQADSRRQQLARYEKRDKPGHGMNRVLDSTQARNSLENHSPRQKMEYTQRSRQRNVKQRSVTAAGEGIWDLAPKVGVESRNIREKIGTKSPRIADKFYLNNGVPMESMQRKLHERGAPPIDTIAGKVTQRRFDMSDLSNAQLKSVNRGIAGSGQKAETLCGPQQSLREIMLEGNGNPITGARPHKYKQYSFRDVELAAKEGCRMKDLADRQSRHLGSQFNIHHT